MQSLEIISVNLWQIVISLCNLLILFLILKKFLFKPVTKAVAARQKAIDQQYSDAQTAKDNADSLRREWEDKMATADEKADAVLQSATETAEKRREAIIEEAHDKAERIIRQAEVDADLERKKAQATIKKEIVDVSYALSEKMLGREISDNDQRRFVDSFLAEIGENNAEDK